MRISIRTVAVIAFFAAAAAGAPAADLGPLAVVVETAVKVPMRDGVTLSADVYRPAAEGKYPVLLQRTPYDRRDPQTGLRLASHGYVVVLQDTRGRFDSGGEFYPFRNEAADGFDTVEWAAALPNADGKVGMFGGSYVGATQMLAAMAKPPHLVAIQPYVTASEYYEGWTYQGGALMEWFVTSWSSGLAVDTLRRKTTALSRPRDWVEATPVESYRLLDLPPVGELAPYLRDWMRHPTRDAYWNATRVSDHYGEMAVKALHQAGWHDIFSRGSIENYIGMRAQAATPEARAGQRLMVGPWAHWSTSPEGKVGDVVFGKDAVVDGDALLLEWAAFALKGEANAYATGAPVRLFVMGDNVWRDEQEFPLARARATRYYLHAAKGANSVAGDGLLSTKPPGKQPPDRFEYDPADPVRTLGGRLCCGAAYQPGPADQRPNESRRDVLVYSTPPLEKDLEVTGFITAEIQAATSAADTDFTAMLVDVDPSGYARYLADGVVRARFRRSREKAEPIVPGQIETYAIDLWATSNVFKAGHRLRLYVSSSNFPRFDRNPNTGESTADSARLVKAQQAVYHDAAHPSALILPVVPRP
ncbi:MAG TPA: CocE/NonD family hydrolase [Vicinamibacteria bacterium]|nr:CocE/NonD family hydrolase [Vicinamibacteria bacterium]